MQIHHILLILWFIVVGFWLLNYFRDKRNSRH
jgi:flagellar biogenesis protein FliO